MLYMTELDLSGKRVMIREDFNVPLSEGKVANDQRLKRALPTLTHALKQNAAVIILSHLGRPKPGQYDAQHSLAPVAEHLQSLLNHPVRFDANWLNGVEVQPGEVVLCENVRFNPGEKENDAKLAKQMASLCDIFVMDAFATAHRKQASTYGIAQHAETACMGPLMRAEVDTLTRGLKHPEHPVVAIVGGAKVAGKLELLTSLIHQVDALIVGGGIANTFLAAQGINIGRSLHEPNLMDAAKKLLDLAKQKSKKIYLPNDVIVAPGIEQEQLAQLKSIDALNSDDMIFDIGPTAMAEYKNVIEHAKTIFWNGPVGVFEREAFSAGTQAIAQAIASSSAFSIAGGGDTLAAIDQFDVAKNISYISTGGGAFLKFLEARTLPILDLLENQVGIKTH